MNILIDIGHPAHVHVFRNYRKEMENSGHRVHFTSRDKECTIDLLDHYGIPFTNIGKPFKGSIRKLLGMPLFTKRILKVAKENQADLFMSISSMYAAQAAWFMNKPHVVLDDTEHSTFEHLLYKPFSSTILTPTCFQKAMGRKQVRYDGFHELAYLHPARFTPDESIRERLGLKPAERMVLIRFVAWNAGHDMKADGFSQDGKIGLVKELAKEHKVFISSEKELPKELEPFRLHTKPHEMLDVLNACSLYIGEGASMASECAMLGTPSIYVNSLSAGTLEEQSAYGLIHQISNGEGVLELASTILATSDTERLYQRRRNMMLENKIDVTEMLVRLSSSYDPAQLPKRFTKLNIAA